MAIQTCPRCGQQLRFPDHVGGMLMACPTCGQEFASDFKIAASPKPAVPAGKTKTEQEDAPPKRPGGFSVVA